MDFITHLVVPSLIFFRGSVFWVLLLFWLGPMALEQVPNFYHHEVVWCDEEVRES